MSVKISIITITFNSERYLEQTITSVMNQSYQDIEYIIVDGGSTDRTLAIIEKYNDHIDRWVSEPDKGIADAMNKGLNLATGDYTLFLHSDDYLISNKSIDEAAKHMKSSKNIIMFNIILEGNGNKLVCKPRGFIWLINFKTCVYHQSVFCSKKLFDKIGTFDTSFRIVMDYDFFLRAYRAKCSVKYVDFTLSLMRLVGLSSQQSWQDLQERFDEEKKVHAKNCKNTWMRMLYKIYWTLYLPYRRICSFYRER